MDVEFKPWPKIPRDKGNVIIITEKIDGTNGCLVIQDGELVAVQSRKRFITPEDDHYGFAAWAHQHSQVLVEELGDGYHYGEWAGEGIQKNPGNMEGRHFFLFNTLRWGPHNPNPPTMCAVVPVLYHGEAKHGIIADTMSALYEQGLVQCYTPEGVVCFYPSTKQMVKYTFKNTEGKWRK